MSIQKTMNKLENVHLQSPDKLLTMYLNTDRRDPDQQGGKWKIALKNGLNSFNEYLDLSNEEEKKRFNSLREKIQNYVSSLERDLPRSIIIFASEDSSIWEAFQLQVPVETNFYWEEYAVLDQMKQIQSEKPLTGLILVQQTQVKWVETAFGQIEDTEMFRFDLDTEEWRRHAGPQPSDITIASKGGSASQDDHFQQRIEANQKRWFKNLGGKLDKVAADRKWEKIIVLGDKGTGHMLSENMNKQIDEVIQKNLLNEQEEKVVEEINA
ncbi:VLRF1 family aeRF1-type release factor [Rossellomorea vietnamensis]|uniref:VLRF1 family aeRF1-type release factor n=1 Tax=Rossellomorea vietnamensis TaxID=218284 RepID=UPI003CE75069